jgi:hypothetical protein
LVLQKRKPSVEIIKRLCNILHSIYEEWPLHQLARLDPCELGKAAIGGLITPDALRG